MKALLAVIVAALSVVIYFLVFHGRCEYKGTVRLDGKTIIITGANAGIGKETAIDLARRGARIICACRSKIRGETAVADIKRASGNENVVFMKLDLASLKSVHEFADKIIANEERLDVLINNAGVLVGSTKETVTEDGFEMLIGVNHLGPFLLTNLLMDLLKKSQPSRIINVSSAAHRMGFGINFDDIMGDRGFIAFKSYHRSKLANILFTLELSKRLTNTAVTVNSLHPGVVNTELYRYLKYYLKPQILMKAMQWMFSLTMKDSRQGAQTTIYCAVDPSMENISGKYIRDCKIAEPSTLGKNETAAKLLWDISEKLVGISG